jgi:pyrimidine-specific ribonucleoside hydrolase
VESVTVVSDGGLDDALALGVLVAAGVEVRQVIATEGSCDLMTTATAAARWLTTLGCSAPVRLGAARGLAGSYPTGRDPFHGTDAFGGQLARLGEAEPPTEPCSAIRGTVLATGALTVVAEGLRRGDPVTRIAWMGGSVAVGGNMTAAAEFNAWMDPLAVDEVLTSGVAMSMVPLDVTTRFRWAQAEVERLGAVGEPGAVLASAIASVLARDGAFVPHDAVAAMALVEPDLFGWERRVVRCETAGVITTGETVVDRRPRAPREGIAVAMTADVAEVNERIFDLLTRLR